MNTCKPLRKLRALFSRSALAGAVAIVCLEVVQADGIGDSASTSCSAGRGQRGTGATCGWYWKPYCIDGGPQETAVWWCCSANCKCAPLLIIGNKVYTACAPDDALSPF